MDRYKAISYFEKALAIYQVFEGRSSRYPANISEFRIGKIKIDNAKLKRSVLLTQRVYLFLESLTKGAVAA